MADGIRILVLEGPLSRGVAELLAVEGWRVTPTTSLSELLAITESGVHLIVLDALAPGMKLATWQEVVQRVSVAVLVIVPGVEPGKRVAALRAPFTREMLLNKVRELLVVPPPRNFGSGNW